MASSEQIHREGDKHRKQIELIWRNLQNNEMTENIEEELNAAIRLFGKNITKLPECNEAVFMLAEIYFKTSEEKLITWSLRDSNAFLLLIVTTLLKRKDEAVIRQAAIIMYKFGIKQRDAEREDLAKFHEQATQLVFHKMSKVATFYTQFKLLAVLHVFLQGLDENVAKVFKKEKLIITSGGFEDAMYFFESLDANDFVMTARNFLDAYNQTMTKPPFISSNNGFLVALNDVKKFRPTQVLVDFCMRNLSISFFVKASVITGDKQLEEETYFVELEDCDITVDSKKFMNPLHVQLIVKPNRSQVLDTNDKAVKTFHSIDSVKIIFLKDDNDILSEVVPRYQSKSPMPVDNNTDIESLVSFHTINTSIRDALPVALPVRVVPKVFDLNTSAEDCSASQNLKKKKLTEMKVAPQQLSVEDIFESQIGKVEPPIVSGAPKRPQKQAQVAKVEPLKARQANPYDNVREDIDRLPSYRQFITQAREKRRNRQTQQEPVAVKTDVNQTSRKAPAKKKAPAKRQPTSTKRTSSRTKKASNNSSEGEVEDEIMECFGEALHPSEPLAPLQKEPKRQRKTRAKSDAVLDSSAEDRAIMDMLPSAADVRQRIASKKSYFTKAKPKSAAAKKTPTKRQPTKSKKPVPSKTVVVEEFSTEDDEFEKTQSCPSLPLAKAPPIKAIKSTRQVIEANAETVQHPEVIQRQTESTRGQTSIHRTVAAKQEKQAILNTLSKKPAPTSPPPTNLSFRRLSSAISPSSEIQRHFELATRQNILNDSRTKRSRPDGEERHQPAKKGRNDFDQLLKESTRLEKTTIRLKKRESFGNNVEIHVQSPPEKRAKYSHVEVESKENKAPQPLPVKYNTSMLDKNPLLNEFINNSQQHSSIENDDFDEVIMTAQTIQKKKSSPTIVQTVQYRRVNENAEPQMQPLRIDTGGLSELFMQKAQKEVDHAMKELQTLQAPTKTFLNPATKESIGQAIAAYRASEDRVKQHISEHIKLLKRVHHSKRSMMQLFDENDEAVRIVRAATKQGMIEARQQYDERIQQIGQVHQSLINKQESLKQEVWRQHLNEITSHFNSMIQGHYEI